MISGTERKHVKPGLEVDIVLKKDQPTGKLTRGIVKQLLTSKAKHPRGIKVRLESGQVGRVQNIYIDGIKYENPPYQPGGSRSSQSASNAADADFDNFI